MLLTDTARWLETPDGQVTALAETDLVGGDWHLATRLLTQLRAVTAADVQRAAQKHVTNLQTVIVGDPAKLTPAVVGAK